MGVPRLSAILLVAALVACSDSGASTNGSTPPAQSTAPVVQLGAPGETSRVLTSLEVAALPTTPPPTAADIEFMTGMIHHHQQALDMVALVADRAERSDLGLMAERMRVGQVDEIALMQQWLSTHGEPVPNHEHGHGELMPGMLTDGEMSALAAASGTEFDELFLVSMIRHHEGAISMVQTLYDGGNGQEPALFQLAEMVSSDQAVEVARMKSVLAELEAD